MINSLEVIASEKDVEEFLIKIALLKLDTTNYTADKRPFFVSQIMKLKPSPSILDRARVYVNQNTYRKNVPAIDELINELKRAEREITRENENKAREQQWKEWELQTKEKMTPSETEKVISMLEAWEKELAEGIAKRKKEEYEKSKIKQTLNYDKKSL